MKPSSDEALILYYYGEADDPQRIADQLESSPELRQRYAALCLVLDAVDDEPLPEPPAAYGSRIWHRLAARLETSSPGWGGWSWLRPRRQWALASVLAVLLVTAFLAGRQMPDPDAVERAGLSSDGRERILLMTVAGHLERSEMLLLELVNTVPNGDIDLSLERQLAAELGQESRLYRQAAKQAGKADVVRLLEQLETVLVELSNGPSSVPSTELGDLRLRLDEGDVLFKVRVLGTRLRREVDARSGQEDSPPATREL